MDKATVTLQVFFQEPFWIGIFERTWDNKLSVCKVTFGPEPKDYEIQDFLLRNYYGLRFSPPVAALQREQKCSPKRVQRQIRKQLETMTTGTRSQQALKLQQEQSKTVRKTASKEQKEAEQERRFQLKQQKKKEKHRGR